MTKKYSVVTSYNKRIFDECGWKFTHSFCRHWPAEVGLICYEEGAQIGPATPRIEYFNLETACPPLVEFRRRHPEPRARGKIADGQGRVQYDYRMDAVRFANKAFALSHGARTVDSDRVIWLDADVITHAPVTLDFLDSLLPDDCYCSYLGRSYTHTESGFLMFDARHSKHEKFMIMLAGVFATDEVFSLPEWNDAYVFDVLRLGCESEGWFKSHNLAADIPTVEHVFINSVLGSVMDHMKGARKTEGRSYARDLVAPRSEPYWQP